MKAEQLLQDSFIYEQPDLIDPINKTAAKLLGQNMATAAESTEGEHEISIPQESSIAGNISM